MIISIFNEWVGSVVLGGEYILILLLFIGVMAAGCWSELRGGCFWEIYNVLFLCLNQSGTFGLAAPERLVAFWRGY